MRRPNPHAYFGDDLEAAIKAQREAHGGLLPEPKPAHLTGLTMLQASAHYARPINEVRRAFIYGAPPQVAPIGQRDPWDVWFTTKGDADALFGSEPGAPPPRWDREAEAKRTVAQARAHDRVAELRRRLGLAA